MNVRLALGLLLILLAWWCGPQGYGDLSEYAQITDQLWHHGTFALPTGVQSRFCWGFPALLLPLRMIGAWCEMLAGREDIAQWLMSALPPCATIVTACLIERFARAKGATRADAVRAAVLTACAASTLYYSRLLNLEPVVGCLLVAAVVVAEESRGIGRAIVAGTCLGVAFSCHYANAPGIGIIALGLAWRMKSRLGFIPAATLGVSALVWVLITAWSNDVRYGAIVTSGYNHHERVGLSLSDLVSNIPIFLTMLAIVPWLAPVIGWTIVRRQVVNDVISVERICAVALLAQLSVWLGTWQFSQFPLRYLTAWIMFSGLLLPALLVGLRSRYARWSVSAIRISTVAILFWSVVAFLGWRDFCRPLSIDLEHPWFPGQVLAATWYQPRDPYTQAGPYLWKMPGAAADEFLYPERPVTMWTVLFGMVLMTGGALLIIRAVRPQSEAEDTPIAGMS